MSINRRHDAVMNVIFHYQFLGWSVKNADYENYTVYFQRRVQQSCFLGLIKYYKTEYLTIHVNEYLKSCVVK